jgi:predicted anti-sigma-YlaC factor YlaD
MPCTEFEDLLAGYTELAPAERQRADAHLHCCPACRCWFEALAEVDSALVAEFAGVHAPATLRVAVRRKVSQSHTTLVSAVPEVLDFVGWLGVICAAGLLVWFTIPPSYVLSAPVLFTLSGLLLCLALSVTLWVLHSSES